MSDTAKFIVTENSTEWIDWIEEAIAKKYFKYYEYNHFSNIQEIGSGSFGKVYRVNWKSSHKYLALKSFSSNDHQSTVKEIVNELKLQREVDFHENIIRFCGLTTIQENQNDSSKKYMLVMEYADSGTLRDYLKEHFDNLTWEDKFNLALQLAHAVSCLHDERIVHRDLHSKNILVHRNTIKLADFGLSKRIEDASSNSQAKLFGVVPYVDPKSFGRRVNNNNFYSLNEKSDVYSVGVLLWEISSGKPPFYNEGKPYEVGLAVDILQGFRETPIPNTPEDYVKIYTDCWSGEPNDRPTINQVIAKLKAIITKDSVDSRPYNTVIQAKVSENVNNNSLHGNLSQLIQDFNKMNTREITSISSLSDQNVNKVVLSENNLNAIVYKINDLFNSGIEEMREQEILNYLNDHNITSQEVYNWSLDNQNDSNSIFLLGAFNYLGIEMSVDKGKAFKLFQKAANLGNEFGISELGYCYLYGFGTRIDKKMAFELFKEAAILGHANGIVHLGTCYKHGIGTSINSQKAFELFQEAANLECTDGMISLGYCYQKGIGTNIDNQKAFELFQKAANLGNLHGMNSLGCCYQRGIGTSIDNRKAFELYQEAANLGNCIAQYNLASIYKSGVGIVKNIDRAIYWYKKSADNGYQNAQNELEHLKFN